MIKGLPHVRTPAGIDEPMTDGKVQALRQLLSWPDGCGSMPGVLNGGTLAALVQFGLVERMSPDHLGGCRYRISFDGRKFLRNLEQPA